MQITIAMDFETGIPVLPEETLILFDEERGSVKTAVALILAAVTAADGKSVGFITSRTPAEVTAECAMYQLETLPIEVIPQPDSAQELPDFCRHDICIIGYFTPMCTGMDSTDLKVLMKRLIQKTREGHTILLLADSGILPPEQEALMQALSDGHFTFLSVKEGSRIRRYIRQHKMKQDFPSDRMILFSISRDGFVIDTRERHG